uniref:Choline transporter-like protein n=1 Tax=Bicosoecida sp. CB-2014 TaxID=1486930 RepID=A0A7S1G5S8_9STRA
MDGLAEPLSGNKYGKHLNRSDVARLPTSKSERGCTDVLCCVVFLVFWAAMGFVAFSAVGRAGGVNGYERVVYGVQYDGSVCGRDADVADKPFIYWPDAVHYPRLQVCVAACPTAADAGSTTLTVPPNGGHVFTTYATETAFHYCIPVPGSVQNSNVLSELDNSAFAHVISDLGRSWPVLLGCAFIALAAGFAYLLLLRHTAGVLVWLVIFAIMGGLAGAGYMSWSHAKGMADGAAGKDVQMWVGIGLWVADAIFVCIICGLRRSIVVAVAVLKEATKAVRDMKQMLVIPPVKFLVILAFFAYWTSVAVYMVASTEGAGTLTYNLTTASNGTISVPTSAMEWSRDDAEIFALHFFSLLWAVAFLIALGDLILSHAVAQWYFKPFRDGVKTLDAPVSTAVGVTLRYHLGTAAFGSCVLALVSFVKWVMQYAHKKLHGKRGDTGPLKLALCLCMCCVACFEKVVKFLNRQVYVQTSLFGTSFCTSAKNSFSLVARNAGRVASLSAISGIFLMLGTLLVMAVTSVSAYLLTTHFYSGPDGVSSPVAPTVVACVIGYVVGAVFTQVFDVAISTVLHCFIADVDAHSEEGGVAHSEYASPELVRVCAKKD